MGPKYFSLPLSIVLLLHFAAVHSQSLPPAAATGPANITKILEKASQFTTLLRLLRITQIGDQINTQLNNSNQGLTVFSPTDAAFAALPAGTLNALSDQQKVSLILFHILPTFLSIPQFQTVSNPLRTQAGDTGAGEFPLNVTSVGNQVNISTGVDDAAVSNTIYSDNQLAMYLVDKVLLPVSMFGNAAPAPAPSEAAAKKKMVGEAAGPSAGFDSPADSSDAVGRAVRGIIGAALTTGLYVTKINGFI